MNKFLNKIRSIENEIPITRKIINTILILCFGIVLGTFAKFLDIQQAILYHLYLNIKILVIFWVVLLYGY